MVNRFLKAPDILGGTTTAGFAGCCLLCGGRGQARLDICLGCQQDLTYLTHACHRCALPLTNCCEGDPERQLCGLCLQVPPPYLRTEAIWLYQPPIAQLISSFKYQNQYCYGRILCLLGAKKIVSAYTERDFPELITATPLHWTRRLQRGFNQSERLARYWAKQLGIPYQHCLRRIRATPAQQTLSAANRQRNLHNAFTVCADVSGKRIALVDDVITTGATASELSCCLLAAGAAEVHMWCLARTPY